jgi:hypothetical protein
MNTRQKQNAITDTLLFGAFLLAFFLDLTGVNIHQWLGMIAGAMGLIHLALHWKWVLSVGSRFFGSTSMRSRAYYALDAGILAGFAGMIGSGLVISTWLNVALADYASWRALHIGISIFTLIAVLVKLAAHWKWIAAFFKPRPASLTASLVPTGSRTDFMAERREFIKVMGVLGLASGIALVKSTGSLVQAAHDEAVAEQTAVQPAAQTGTIPEIADTSSQASAVETVSTTAPTEAPKATAEPTIEPTALPTAVPTMEAASAATVCQVLCNRKCASPGRCRRYTDSNGDNLCDRGQCI